MIVLHEANALGSTFETLGIGSLEEATSALVVEELNGSYELELDYPLEGTRFNDIKLRSVIYCKPHPFDDPEPFRVYAISKPINGIITVNACHLSYDTDGIPVNPFKATSPSDAVTKMKNNSVIEHPFELVSTSHSVGEFEITSPKSLRSLLGGELLTTYSCDLYFNGTIIHHVNHRGMDRGAIIKYGKNLTDINQEENISNVYTHVYPYWYHEADGLVTTNEKLIPVPGTWSFQRVMLLNVTSDIEVGEGEKPSPDQVKKIAEDYINANNIGIPKVNISLSYQQLSRSVEYSNTTIIEEIRLGDTVTVEFAKMNISAKARCIKTSYNPIKDAYDKLEFGDVVSNLASQIAGGNAALKDQIEQTGIKFDAEVGNIKIDLAKIDTALIGKADIEYLNANFAHITDGIIDNATIGDATITTAKIEDAAVVTAKIGDAQITTAKIGDAQITTAKIKDAAIENAQIANGSIDNAKILDATITGAKIKDASIGTAQIGDAQITVAKIQDAFIDDLVATQGKFESAHIGELTSDNITAGTISANVIDAINMNVSGKISADRIDTSSLVVDEIDAGKITTGTLDADRIGALSITTEKLAAGAVTAEKISANSITSDKIAAGAIIADDIASNAITTNKIVAGAITTDKIGANQITADKIAANSITSDKIAAGTIVADDINASTINTIAVNAGNIVAKDIETGTIKITNANILDGTISGAKITSASITNAQIKDATIESAKIKDLNASKITTGTLDTTKVSVNSTSGNLTIQDNTIQIKDSQSTPKVRVQIGKDNTNQYGILVFNAAGTAIFDSDHGVLVKEGLNDGIVSTDKIVDNAVSPPKIQIKELWAEEAYINEFNGQTVNADNITTGTISGERIDINGLIKFEALDKDLSKLFIPNSGSGTMINGGFIGTDTIKANSIDLYSGLVVRREDTTISFAVSANGDVNIDGNLQSAQFDESRSMGYRISTDGTAVLNQARITGEFIMPNAGITNYGATIGNQNAYRSTSFNGSGATITYDSTTNEWTVVVPASTTSWRGIQYSSKDAVVKAGDIAVISYDVYTDVDGLEMHADVNNLPVDGSGGSNDNDETSKRVYVQPIPTKGEWIRHYVKYEMSSSKELDYYDRTTICVKNGTNTGGVTFKVRNIKFEISDNGLPTPWCPSPDEQKNYTRIWAGTNYENRDIAPFKVMQDGSITALNGTFTGSVYGNYDNDRIHIHDNEIVIDSVSTFVNEFGEEQSVSVLDTPSDSPYVKLSSEQSIFNTDLILGSRTSPVIKYSKSSKELEILDAVTTFQGDQSSIVIDKNSGTFGGLNIKAANGGHQVIRHSTSSDKIGTLVFDSQGSQGVRGDFSFTRGDYNANNTCVVDIDGVVSVRDSIKSTKQNIEIRSIAGEGWGFYTS